MTDKLRELASDMEANKPVNNPGNWNMLLAIADRLEAKDKEIAELKEAIRLYQFSIDFSDNGNPCGSLNAEAQRERLFEMINPTQP
jgi:hypothetical protein